MNQVGNFAFLNSFAVNFFTSREQLYLAEFRVLGKIISYYSTV